MKPRHLPTVALGVGLSLLSSLIADDKEPDLVVTATRLNRPAVETPFMTKSISNEEFVSQRLSRNFAEILEEESILVQKTANGQGSPYIRGWTGFRTLLMIDGIRVNNSTFRDGPNQYWATLDPWAFRSVEVVRGPASVLHGSDAIGGAVNALTLNPRKGTAAGGRFIARLSTAEHSNSERLEFTSELENGAGIIGGVSRREFGDVKAGDGAGRQRATGYDEPGNFDAKAIIPLGNDAVATLAHQHVFQDDVWRSHKTIYGDSWHGTTVGSDLHRILDQTRDLTYARFEGNDLKVTLSHHLQLEEQSRLRSNLRTENTWTRVQTWGLQAQHNVKVDDSMLIWGFDYYRDHVDSHFDDTNPNGTPRTLRPRGPVADNSTYSLFGGFAQLEFTQGDWTFIPGIRYTLADVDADKVDPIPSDATPFSRVSRTYERVTGSFRTLHKTTSWMNTYLGVSQGFRAPNLSDYTRFDTARTNEIQTPTDSLDGEDFVSAEIGAKIHDDIGYLEAAYFHTWVDDLIIRRPTGRVVSGSQEVKAANSGQGMVEGVEVRGNWYATDSVSVKGDFTWNRGRVDDYPTPDVQSRDRHHLSRVTPKTGSLGVRYDFVDHPIWVEGIGRFTRHQKRLSPKDSTDTQRFLLRGTPGHNIYTIRGGWEFIPETKLTLAVENLTNKAWRPHGSGQNEPGRNVIFGLDSSF